MSARWAICKIHKRIMQKVRDRAHGDWYRCKVEGCGFTITQQEFLAKNGAGRPNQFGQYSVRLEPLQPAQEVYRSPYMDWDQNTTLRWDTGGSTGYQGASSSPEVSPYVGPLGYTGEIRITNNAEEPPREVNEDAGQDR